MASFPNAKPIKPRSPKIDFLVPRGVQHRWPMPPHDSRVSSPISTPLLLALGALVLLFFVMESARPCYFLNDDNADWFIGAYVHDYRVLSETGRLAEVNYFQHGGEPFVEQGQTAVLYPPVYLAVFCAKNFSGDLRWSLEWMALINLAVGLAGFYSWLQQGGVAPWHAAIAGLAWAFNPFVLIIAESWIFTTHVAAWLPWVFWSVDRLLARPSASSAFYLGISTSLLLLQGYVQYFAYAMLFLVIYAIFQFATRREVWRLAVAYRLFLSMLVFTILALPLLLPMQNVVNSSAMRSAPQPIDAALYYSVAPLDIVTAQVLDFNRWIVFGASAAILYCPAVLLVPVVVIRLFYADRATRWRLAALLVLGALAITFTTNAHWLLLQLPVYNRFRWPFKMFLFADFFFLAALAWSASSWTKPPASHPGWGRIAAGICVVVVMLANLDIALAYHDEDRLSWTDLSPTLEPLPRGLDRRFGRVITVSDDDVDQPLAGYFYTRAYATFFGFPSIGGYNPLVRGDILSYSLNIDYPNVCTDKITPDYVNGAEAKCVRYWIFNAHSSHYAEAKKIPQFRVVQAGPERVILEDEHAAPLVCSDGNPSVPRLFNYAGNSLLIPLEQMASPVSVSVAPTDGWWYRIDGGNWQRAIRQDERLIIPISASDQKLEVTFFDPRFWLALKVSFGLAVVLAALLIRDWRLAAAFRR